MIVIHEDCDPSLSNESSLPNNAFLVEYIQGETSHYDIVMSSKKVDIFDSYWDKYRENLLNITQSNGRVNPKLWNPKKK